MVAQLDRPILPQLLYRYRPLRSDEDLRRELDAINGQHLWSSSYRSLNDPMEGFYEPASRLQKNSAYARIARDILEAKRELGICCFSDTYANELMWTHYSSNYAGICVGYGAQKLVDGLPDNVHLVRLFYDGAPPKLREADARDPQSAAIKVLSHKKANWIYEREWRLVGQRLGTLPITGKGCVREVYLGVRVSDHHKRIISDELRGMNLRISAMSVSDYNHKWDVLQRLK